MPIPETASLSRSFIRDDVYASLKAWIIRGDLAPGEKLKDKALAAQLGVSRTPVREALRRLEDEGLVETAANRWTRVSGVARHDAQQIYPIILRLELLALELAFAKLQGQLAAMKTHNASLQGALTASDARAAVRADAAFHKVIIETAENPELASILEQLKSKCQRIELAYFGDAALLHASVDEHRQLIDAVKGRNLEDAQGALRHNWQASLERLTTLGGP